MERIGGRVIRTGVPLPPASGPARQRVMRRDGHMALRESTRAYADSCRLLGEYADANLSDIPTWEQTTADLAWRGINSTQAQQRYLRRIWEPVARQLRRRARRRSLGPAAGVLRVHQTRMPALDLYRFAQHGLRLPTVEALTPTTIAYWEGAERLARHALTRAVDAFNFLEETSEHEAAHRHAHEVAAFVSGLWGCEMTFEDGLYWDVCPVSLMHMRWGLSAGFTAVRLCSLCGEDLDECPHMIDTLYEVVVSRTPDGSCTACGGSACGHVIGEMVQARPHPIIREASLHEVSVVRTPRDPLARITRVDISPDLLRGGLGTESDDQLLTCYRCLHPCNGFTYPAG